jgi:membrane-bound lytic murein transglycosylase A
MISIKISLFKSFFLLGACLLLFGCSSTKQTVTHHAHFKVTHFKALKGWDQDNHLSALQTYLKSCQAISKKKPDAPISGMTKIGGNAKDWQKVCQLAKSSDIKNAHAAKKFFEHWFKVYKISDNQGNSTGKVTGYYQIMMNGSNIRTELY